MLQKCPIGRSPLRLQNAVVFNLGFLCSFQGAENSRSVWEPLSYKVLSDAKQLTVSLGLFQVFACHSLFTLNSTARCDDSCPILQVRKGSPKGNNALLVPVRVRLPPSEPLLPTLS